MLLLLLLVLLLLLLVLLLLLLVLLLLLLPLLMLLLCCLQDDSGVLPDVVRGLLLRIPRLRRLPRTTVSAYRHDATDGKHAKIAFSTHAGVRGQVCEAGTAAAAAAAAHCRPVSAVSSL